MKRKRAIIIGVALIQLLLMGSAFVGGRMIGEQNRRTNRTGVAVQLPSQLPKDPAAGTGTVQSLQDNLITLGRGGGGGQSANSQTEIAITSDTKFYKNASAAGQPGLPGQPGGQPQQVQVSDATLTDVKIGNNVMVWGTKNGARITAEVIYIQNAGR